VLRQLHLPFPPVNAGINVGYFEISLEYSTFSLHLSISIYVADTPSRINTQSNHIRPASQVHNFSHAVAHGKTRTLNLSRDRDTSSSFLEYGGKGNSYRSCAGVFVRHSTTWRFCNISIFGFLHLHLMQNTQNQPTNNTNRTKRKWVPPSSPKTNEITIRHSMAINHIHTLNKSLRLNCDKPPSNVWWRDRSGFSLVGKLKCELGWWN
jgi:hypothetical protein